MTPARKARLTITVDPDLVAAGNQAVESGLADSLSGWVNGALQQQVARDRRLRALADAVTAYEAQFGEITADEIEAVRAADRERAVVVRPRRAPVKSRKTGAA